jgi:hypothetical protein
MDVFDRAWKILEAKSACDARGGAEYTRLRRSWRTFGLLVALDFIYKGANMPPTDEQRSKLTCTLCNEQPPDDQFALIPDPLELPDAPGELPPIPPDLPPVPEK